MRVLIRADASAQIGGGHVMRQLALAEGLLAAGATVQLVAAVLDPGMDREVQRRQVPVTRIEAEPGSGRDEAALRDLAVLHNADFVVLDGYTFADHFTETLHEAGRPVLVVDDFLHLERYSADLILNQNAGPAVEARYRSQGARGELLIGPRYALLRREIASASRADREVPEVARRLLVTMGTADPVGATAAVLEALSHVADPAIDVTVVIGAANPRREALMRQHTDPRIRWLDAPADIAEVMKHAHLAIAAGGVTSLELSCLGIPSMLVVLADNQVDVVRQAAAAGTAVDLGWHHRLEPRILADEVRELCADHPRRARLARAGQQRVDGRGVERVIETMTRHVKDRA